MFTKKPGLLEKSDESSNVCSVTQMDVTNSLNMSNISENMEKTIIEVPLHLANISNVKQKQRRHVTKTHSTNIKAVKSKKKVIQGSSEEEHIGIRAATKKIWIYVGKLNPTTIF